MSFSSDQLPAVNATLNATAAVLLLLGYGLIKRSREQAHKRAMLAAFATSILFLICYLAYHVWPVGAKTTPFRGPDSIKPFYYAMLISHIILAALVPFLAGATIYLGLGDRRAAHRRLARWTFPVWLYVSITGVLVYVVLYHLYPASAASRIIG